MVGRGQDVFIAKKGRPSVWCSGCPNGSSRTKFSMCLALLPSRKEISFRRGQRLQRSFQRKNRFSDQDSSCKKRSGEMSLFFPRLIYSIGVLILIIHDIPFHHTSGSFVFFRAVVCGARGSASAMELVPPSSVHSYSIRSSLRKG